MTDVAIRAEGLGKSYRISHEGAKYRTLRESLVDAVGRPFRRDAHKPQEIIWALRDVDFEVRRGEALGIIGGNGAGKSTLLKILSRITSPTTGRADVYGTLGSLLEVGTGFHPELTGRENVFLNGAILGMRRREIQRRFDEIVAFAEVERFLDTPVKHYSTGMYMRLAFAVAAHLRTDILVVDEVLSVGDAAFQQKCLGKMEDVATEGRTVLFVSHDLAAVGRLCTRVLLMESGAVRVDGPADSVVAAYLSGVGHGGHARFRQRARRAAIRGAAFEWAELRASDGSVQTDYSMGDDVVVAFRLRLAPDRPRTRIGVWLRAEDGTPVVLAKDEDSGFSLSMDETVWEVSVRFTDLRLYPGSYFVTLWAHDFTYSEVFDRVDDALQFRIVGGGRLTGRSLTRRWGLVFLTPAWQAQAASELPGQAGSGRDDWHANGPSSNDAPAPGIIGR